MIQRAPSLITYIYKLPNTQMNHVIITFGCQSAVLVSTPFWVPVFKTLPWAIQTITCGRNTLPHPSEGRIGLISCRQCKILMHLGVKLKNCQCVYFGGTKWCQKILEESFPRLGTASRVSQIRRVFVERISQYGERTRPNLGYLVAMLSREGCTYMSKFKNVL